VGRGPGQFGVAPAGVERGLPGGVGDVAGVGGCLADQGQQRRQLGIEVDPVLADRHGLLTRQAGRFGGQSVGGLAVLTAVDVADDQSDRLAGPRVEGAVVTDDLLQPT